MSSRTAENALELADAARALSDVRRQIEAVRSLIASNSGGAAQKALADLKGMPIPSGEAGIVVSNLINEGLSQLQGRADLAAMEEQINSPDDVHDHDAPFSESGSENEGMWRRPGVRNYADRNLTAPTQQGVSVTVQKDANGSKVVTTGPEETIPTKDVRAALANVNLHSMDEKERCEICGKHGHGHDHDELTKEEAEKLRKSLEKLEKFKAAKILKGPGTKEEKDAKLIALHEKFEDSREKIGKAEKAAAKAKLAPAGMAGAAKDWEKSQRDEMSATLKKTTDEVTDQADLKVVSKDKGDIASLPIIAPQEGAAYAR